MPSHPARRVLLLLLPELVGLAACERSAAPGIADTAVAATDDGEACPTESGQKLGVPFVRICAPLSADAVWIAATPLPCSAGDHETLECPIATSLLVAPNVPTDLLAPRTALLTDGFAAHRLCAMRFGGRLPTPEERRELRRQQGMSSVRATAEADGTIRIDELDEWTASGDCGNPSLPGSDCRFERFPGAAAPAIDWAAMQRCEASAPRQADGAVVSIGGRCPAGVECLLQSPWFLKADSAPLTHALACAPLERPLQHPAPRADVAAFRCVLPRGALAPDR